MKFNFDLIGNINVKDESTWKNKIFLTFDIDWASDEVIEYSIDLVEKFNIPATWFMTHETPLIKRIKENKNFDIGIHPNFNNLLLKGTNLTDPELILDELIKILPETNLLRSHSLFQSERLLDLFNMKGLNFISNTFIPLDKNQLIKPYNIWDNLVILPHCWQDNVNLKMALELPSKIYNEQLIIMDFHPIHIFLNTENISRYERTREFQTNHKKLKTHIFKGKGTRDILIDLIIKYT